MAAIEPNSGEDLTRTFLDEWANWSGLSRLHITFDVDWAPDYMLRNLLELLDKQPEIRSCCTGLHAKVATRSAGTRTSRSAARRVQARRKCSRAWRGGIRMLS